MSTVAAPSRDREPAQAHATTSRFRTVVSKGIDRLAEVLANHSITVLRISLGLVFLVFASFKFVAGASPAEDLAIATVDKLTFGVVSGSAALLLTALTETVIGITLLTGRFVRIGLVVLAGALGGILSPMVLFPDQMWAGNGPTLTGQYVFKDIVLVAGSLVVTAHSLGARLRRTPTRAEKRHAARQSLQD